jgi:anti-anti-sigma factor
MTDEPNGVDDPLRMNLKGDAAHVRRDDAGGVMVFVVENTNIYPKQGTEIAKQVRAALEPADRPRLLLDLSRVEFICSAFIGRLLDLHKRAAARSGALKLCVTGEHVAYTMKLVKLNRIIEIGGDRQELIDSF